ncbi:hypothetical protein KEJ15_07705 [Candidatus Bathyarchaeota archaeon]|nr:hypothetical protein [Candidatus Bathyarchaeota archaeon]
MEFPERTYTGEEVKKAKELIDKGYKHHLTVKGTPVFREKVKKALELVKVADYYEFLRTYIRSIIEIDGLTQLREADSAIWANRYAVENPVDAASLFVQKASSMSEYLEGVLYYGGTAEKRAIEKRVEFIRTLKNKSRDGEIVAECDRLLRFWRESSIVY